MLKYSTSHFNIKKSYLFNPSFSNIFLSLLEYYRTLSFYHNILCVKKNKVCEVSETDISLQDQFLILILIYINSDKYININGNSRTNVLKVVELKNEVS